MVDANPESDATELLVPTPTDFDGIAALQAAAFAEKQGCLSNDGESRRQSKKCYEQYQKQFPQKLEHCRIVKRSSDGMVMAACQLMVKGDPGDLLFPESMRHSLSPHEVYVEWIACHPDHSGKGLGSKLLQWAHTYAKDNVNAKFVSLAVMKANTGAVRLYERKGYVIKKDPDLADVCDEFCQGCFVFFCLGCKYWTVLYMEKPLTDESPSPVAEDMNR
jgi:ribosomal protein S18 acetylase RimI-like enzyme